jgi:hypothetical protein
MRPRRGLCPRTPAMSGSSTPSNHLASLLSSFDGESAASEGRVAASHRIPRYTSGTHIASGDALHGPLCFQRRATADRHHVQPASAGAQEAIRSITHNVSAIQGPRRWQDVGHRQHPLRAHGALEVAPTAPRPAHHMAWPGPGFAASDIRTRRSQPST